ncbi:uncharacterized protein FIBRA_05641 [Fibroporia radiculosa]|uniref:Peptidase S9 prolyl oligopeptidase catalytic domain-containing protein n=1 Tax=Fibroporia radiculosa TaxID=599839 RepID=J4HXW0_9APHY|nr:uncharacterized protein FIBRA_05641 [Fibroporia radiculosa]CCM03507.1 predicted protein [Fibroporia radiculosa]
MPPATGHDILADVKDAIHFISSSLHLDMASHLLESHRPSVFGFKVDPDAIAVMGTSAGGLCAYLAAAHAVPKPKAVLSMYGMGGNLLTSQYFSPKTTAFFRGRELLDSANFRDYLYPASEILAQTSDSALIYHSQTSATPGYPANPRMLLARLYLQLGTFMDYYTGCHDPSLSAALRSAATRQVNVSSAVIEDAIPAEHLSLFPQLQIGSTWPPTFLIHGSLDSAVLKDESCHLYHLLQRAGVDAKLKIIDSEEHSFDYQKDAEEKYGQEGGLFDEIAEFVISHVRL